jgi:hypothetical protein
LEFEGFIGSNLTMKEKKKKEEEEDKLISLRAYQPPKVG